MENIKQLLKLDLACGQRKQEGFIGVDSFEMPGVDIVHNLDIIPWPFENESVEQIHCQHYVEHVKDLMAFMDECYRILAPGGKMHIICPYYTSSRAFQDPTHVRFICETSMLYFNKKWRIDNKLEHYNIKSDFDFSYAYSVSPDWLVKSEEARTFAIHHYWNVVSDIYFTLTKNR